MPRREYLHHMLCKPHTITLQLDRYVIQVYVTVLPHDCDLSDPYENSECRMTNRLSPYYDLHGRLNRERIYYATRSVAKRDAISFPYYFLL